MCTLTNKGDSITYLICLSLLFRQTRKKIEVFKEMDKAAVRWNLKDSIEESNKQ